MPNILIADDEKEIIKLLRIYLEGDGTCVYEANDGVQALGILEKTDIDLALVDIMMPKIDGYQVIKKIRQKDKYIPIIVLSAKVTLSDRVLGIDLGADDYITKPFEPLEVAAKVKAQLRRLCATAAPEQKASVITSGYMTLDLDKCTFIGSDGTVELTKAEFKVLELLMSQPKRVFTKEQIYESAWYDDGAVDDNTIRVIISRLREKIGAQHIKTIRGLGYRFE
ncbi:MAG: response regulator transcription factor [Ruminococcus sp.]|nr:response regulator transcription factor [Ruminococcus sp.]MBR1752390.1 response regulator transcription factor [Ruminococcus sp.]